MGAYMRILLPTGTVTYEVVSKAAMQYDADVVVTGEIASFLTPARLKSLIKSGQYDMVIVSGMCTASFAGVEEDTGVAIYRGPKHASDLDTVLSLLEKVTLSRTTPADEYLREQWKQEAMERIGKLEAETAFDFMLGSLKIGGSSRIKVLAEIMDAHKREDLAEEVNRFFVQGADIVDLGFGFDAFPEDVTRCLKALQDVEGTLALDSQDPDLIRAALGKVDLILSLHEGNIPIVGEDVAKAGAAAVIVPRERGLSENIRLAEETGITRIVADPLLQPVGSGLVESLSNFKNINYPIFFGAGNVVELIDADSTGMNALLAGMAHECGAAIIFTSEHSDKTRGSVTEMRRAVEMMALMEERPYPKDLGIDLLILKEKRRRMEPPLSYKEVIEAESMPENIQYDPKGNMRIGIEDGKIVAVHKDIAIRGKCWEDVYYTLQKQGRLSRLDHAAYLGKELFKAELGIKYNRSFEQDGDF